MMHATALASMLHLIDSGARVLDVGCSSLELDRQLTDRGCTVVAVVQSGTDETAMAGSGAQIVSADLDFQSLTDVVSGAVFDVAIFGDILERLHDPWSVLDAARGLLGPEARAIVHLRNSAHGAIQLSERAGTLEYEAYGILDGKQLRFFTRDSLEQLFVRSGFLLERVETTTVPLFERSPALPDVNAGDFDAETISDVRADPDAETFAFIALARPLDDREKGIQLQRAYVSAASKLSGAKDALAKTKRLLGQERAERSALQYAENALAETKRLLAQERAERSTLQTRFADLDALRTRAAETARELGEELERKRRELADAERETASGHRAFAALSERYEALSAERRTLEAYCLRLAGETATARRRMLAAERELSAWLRPLADEVGSLESAVLKQNTAFASASWVPSLIAQIAALDQRLHERERHLREHPLVRISDRVTTAVKRLSG